MTDYRAAGVSIEANDKAVELIRKRIGDARAVRPEVVGGIGGFSGAFRASFKDLEDPILLATTDGVGTKLVIAQALGRHDTVGFDAVAMVVDDLVCDGAEPLFVLDYISCGRNVPERTAAIVGGVAEACAFAGCALLGGEISEHPGIMGEDEYDLVAFAVGVADRARMLGPGKVREGDAVIGLASSGLHSNGYSLVRRLILDHDLSLSMEVPNTGRSLGEELLEPCRIHAPAALDAMRAADVHAAAHVTAGGIAGNLSRVVPRGAHLDSSTWQRRPIFEFLQETGRIPEEEMGRVFNCGLGMLLVVAADDAPAALEAVRARGETASIVGEITAGHGIEMS